jgi:hypothetical protein
MPRLNYGTLLENIVVLESTRYLLETVPNDGDLAFATSFAMPPLTQCWCKGAEVVNNPYFNNAFLDRLAASGTRSSTLQSFWSLCFKNQPQLPVRPFYQADGCRLYESSGPNGALLAAMWALLNNRPIHLWVNDNYERYPESRTPSA